MRRGLDLILSRLREQPSPILANRYLALVAELVDEREKFDRILDLAEYFLETRPKEALRLALMAHKAYRDEVRPFDIMIAVMDVRGKNERARVLRNERDRLRQQKTAMPPLSVAQVKKPPTVRRLEPPPKKPPPPPEISVSQAFPQTPQSSFSHVDASRGGSRLDAFLLRSSVLDLFPERGEERSSFRPESEGVEKKKEEVILDVNESSDDEPESASVFQRNLQQDLQRVSNAPLGRAREKGLKKNGDEFKNTVRHAPVKQNATKREQRRIPPENQRKTVLSPRLVLGLRGKKPGDTILGIRIKSNPPMLQGQDKPQVSIPIPGQPPSQEDIGKQEPSIRSAVKPSPSEERGPEVWRGEVSRKFESPFLVVADGKPPTVSVQYQREQFAAEPAYDSMRLDAGLTDDRDLRQLAQEAAPLQDVSLQKALLPDAPLAEDRSDDVSLEQAPMTQASKDEVSAVETSLAGVPMDEPPSQEAPSDPGPWVSSSTAAHDTTDRPQFSEKFQSLGDDELPFIESFENTASLEALTVVGELPDQETRRTALNGFRTMTPQGHVLPPPPEGLPPQAFEVSSGTLNTRLESPQRTVLSVDGSPEVREHRSKSPTRVAFGGPMALEGLWGPALESDKDDRIQEGSSPSEKSPADKPVFQNRRVFPSPVLERLIAEIKGADLYKKQDFVWSLLQGLWGEFPEADTVYLLEQCSLTHVSLPYWGFYLRSLIATGDHRRALNEIRFTLRLHKTLPWATLAFGLLPKIWEGLGVRGFSWEPEWGIQPLVDSLNRVPKPSLVSLVTGDSYQLIEDLTCDVPAEKGPGSESLF